MPDETDITDFRQMIEGLRQIKDSATDIVADATGDPGADQGQIGKVAENASKLREQLRILENLKGWIETKNLEAQRLLDEVQREADVQRRGALQAEAEEVLAKVREATERLNRIPELSCETVTEVQNWAGTMRELAQDRERTVENINTIVNIVSGAVEIAAKFLPLAALAI